MQARVFANFLAGRQQRQVDLLVVTELRLVHAELKNLDPTLPVIARANGPWRQRLPDGQERPFQRNFYRKAHDTTYAISDVMRQLASQGEVPAAAGPFYGFIDTVLCLHPEIPAGSKLDRYRHVDVVGYDELLVRLTTSGPRPVWAAEHWDAFARKLGVYQEPTDSPRRESEPRGSTWSPTTAAASPPCTAPICTSSCPLRRAPTAPRLTAP